MVIVELGKFIRDDKYITRRELLVTFLGRKVTHPPGDSGYAVKLQIIRP
ncbi:hypothetical protein [Dongshaea marina]|nr:hypothetical protein [Dongshaea marina]